MADDRSPFDLPGTLQRWLQRLGGLLRPRPRPDPLQEFPARVVVRFRPGLHLPPEPQPDDLAPLSGWQDAIRDFPVVSLQRVFSPEAQLALERLIARARRRTPGFEPADFAAFYYVNTRQDQELDAQRLVEALVLARKVVETAYVYQPGPTPAVAQVLGGHVAEQIYRGAAPDGIDAEYASTISGGDGLGQHFDDVEQGWTLDHRDLAALMIPCMGTILNSGRAHGTSVLGVVCGQNVGGTGCLGIAPRANVSVHAYNSVATLAEVITIAAAALPEEGGTLLIEAQVYIVVIIAGKRTRLLGPVDAYDLEFECVRTATAAGVAVVEAGGNGSKSSYPPLPDTPIDFDAFVNASGLRVLDRNVRDSGAIMVSAAHAPAAAGGTASARLRMAYAPYGNRIDCFAWGERIVTCASDSAGCRTCYTSGFDGTSGAAAIIAGAAVAFLGATADGLPGVPCDPVTVRTRLSDARLGTPSDPSDPHNIGVMPDLRRLV
jgi:serine protease